MTREEVIKQLEIKEKLIVVGESFTHENLSYLDLTDATFRGCEFIDVEFKQSILKFAKFINCTFANVTFSFSELLLAEFKDCHISYSSFKHSNLERIKMKNIEGGLIDMLYCEINNAYIANTNIKELEISHSNLCKTQIYGTLSKQNDLPKLLISECNMTESMFANIKINNGTLINCNMENARLYDMNLNNTKLSNINFDNVYMYMTILSRCCFSNSSITNTKFTTIPHDNIQFIHTGPINYDK